MVIARLTGSAAKGTGGALSIFAGSAIALPILAEAIGFRWKAAAPLVAATDPMVFVPWILSTSNQKSLEPGLWALVFEVMIVGSIVWATVHFWESLSRRKI